MMCRACGRALNANMRFCPTCGQPVAPAVAVPTQAGTTLEARQAGVMAATPVATTTQQSIVAQQQAFCTKCGAALQEGLAFCTACGAPRPTIATTGLVTGEVIQVQPAMSFCVKCGSAFDASSAYCTKCGASCQVGAMTAPNAEARAKNALLIETIGGYFCILGLGHIYSGRKLLGIALMIAWWFGLGILVGIAGTDVGLLLAVCAFFGIPYFSGTQARNYIRTNRA